MDCNSAGSVLLILSNHTKYFQECRLTSLPLRQCMGLENCFRSYEFKTQLKKRSDFHYLPICLFCEKLFHKLFYKSFFPNPVHWLRSITSFHIVLLYLMGCIGLLIETYFLTFHTFCSQCLITNSSEFHQNHHVLYLITKLYFINLIFDSCSEQQ